MSEFTARPEHGIVWIAGASSGIGRALALKLAGEGYKVAVTAPDHEKLVELQAEAGGLSGSIIVLDGEVTDPDDMEHVVAAIEYEHGTLAMAVLNAGAYLPVEADEFDREDFGASFAVNLTGVVNCLVPAVHHMKAKGQGQIAIVSSIAGYGGQPGSAAYGAAGAALINMAESLKFDVGGLGIRVQLVCLASVHREAARGTSLAMSTAVSTDEAAARISAGLKSRSFEIVFPRPIAYRMKLLRLLPYWLYFRAVNRVAGRTRRPATRQRRTTPHPAE